ncbi:unnamed protein product [Allacma fusca]|uniref:F-box domain-containing protein n=1 Tax=Allacma fusca TaxID=39272 RepID=A0A8J2KDD6_9HEXA|nr:unnamed protein product [Allacma fusca]
MAEEALSENSCVGKKQRILGEDILTPTKFDPSGLNSPASVLLIHDEDNRRNNKLAEAALSNFVILRNIFSTLKTKDLESCCHVSQYWRTVADPLIITHYDIALGREGMGDFDDDNYDDAWVSDHVVIKERARYNPSNFREYESNFEGISNTLEEVLQTQKISINLLIYGHIDTSHENVTRFMTKFGSFVRSLSFGDEATMTIKQFCKLVVHNFPNLERLNCSMIRLTEYSTDKLNFNLDLPENKLHHLKRIHFSLGVEFKFECFVTILKIAPNLEEIRDFPIQLVNSLVITQKARTLKSLVYPHNEPWLLDANGETIVTVFEKLAQLQPKLESFRFVPTSFWPVGFLPLIKSQVYSVLQSSEASLKTLSMIPSESYGFQNTPPLKALKAIEFQVTGINDEHYFPADISLAEIFPNVTDVSIFMKLSENIVNHYFPPNVFSPWGSQIRKLKLLLGNCKRFFRNWYNRGQGWSPWSLTLITVSLPDLVTQLKDPLTRENFTSDHIQEFRSGSTIGKLKKLKALKLILRNRFLSSDFNDKLPTLSQVSNDFAFSLLPDLKVTVGVWKNLRFAEEIKTSLQPLVNSIIDVDGYYFEDDLLLV